MRKYLERGDSIKVDDLEMFVLNSYPDHGFISTETNVLFKFGLNKDRCLEKIHRADDEYAMNLFNSEERSINLSFSNNENIPQPQFIESSRISLHDLLNRLTICIIN